MFSHTTGIPFGQSLERRNFISTKKAAPLLRDGFK